MFFFFGIVRFYILFFRCEPTCSRLEREGFLAAYISAQMVQTERDSVIEKLKQNKLKVLVSTDLVSRTIVSVRWHYSLCAMKYFLFFLTARGIDASSVNLVVNLETAINLETYFHRIGRAARYGGFLEVIRLLVGSTLPLIITMGQTHRRKAPLLVPLLRQPIMCPTRADKPLPGWLPRLR